jgi:hypothetical protein
MGGGGYGGNSLVSFDGNSNSIHPIQSSSGRTILRGNDSYNNSYNNSFIGGGGESSLVSFDENNTNISMLQTDGGDGIGPIDPGSPMEAASLVSSLDAPTSSVDFIRADGADNSYNNSFIGGGGSSLVSFDENSNTIIGSGHDEKNSHHGSSDPESRHSESNSQQDTLDGEIQLGPDDFLSNYVYNSAESQMNSILGHDTFSQVTLGIYTGTPIH